MSFPTVVNDAIAQDYEFNAITGYFNGSSSVPANPITLITLNDQTNYVMAQKNLDQTNGRVAIFYKADNTVLARITKDGFRFSPNGVIEDLTPVSITGTEAITGPKTFTKLIYKRATTTASAAALTLPTNGNIVPITGITMITSITSTAYGDWPVTLEFASDGCVVRLGSTGTLHGDYISEAGGTLTLYYDGNNWHEITRGAHRVPGARYRLSAATTQILQDGDRVITWTVNDATNRGMSAVPVSQIIPGILGWWRTSGVVVWDDNPTGHIRSCHLWKNGSGIQRLFDWIGGGANDSSTGVFDTEIEVTSITDYYEMALWTANTNNIVGGAGETTMCWSYIGR